MAALTLQHLILRLQLKLRPYLIRCVCGPLAIPCTRDEFLLLLQIRTKRSGLALPVEASLLDAGMAEGTGSQRGAADSGRAVGSWCTGHSSCRRLHSRRQVSLAPVSSRLTQAGCHSAHRCCHAKLSCHVAMTCLAPCIAHERNVQTFGLI